MGKAKPVPPVTNAKRGTAARMVEVAVSQVGVIEGPKNNETDYGKFTGSNFQPWCGSFVMWCAHETGVKIPNTVYTPAGANAFKKGHAWSDAAVAVPQPGDIVYFDFPGGEKTDHVGIVVKDNKDGTVTTIEGNTSASGSQSNGGEVCKKIRAYKAKNKPKLGVFISGFGRPQYKPAEINSQPKA